MMRFLNIAPFCLAFSGIPELSRLHYVSQAIACGLLIENNFKDVLTIGLDGNTDINFLTAPQAITK